MSKWSSLGGSPTPAPPTSFSPQQRERLAYKPTLPAVLASGACVLTHGEVLKPENDSDRLKELFPSTFGLPTAHFTSASTNSSSSSISFKSSTPLRVGCVLSGGQAPGGHNVISGLFDSLKAIHPDSVLFGFMDGPRGLFKGNFFEITPELMDGYRNMGGFDIIGSGRDKIETPEQFAGAKEVAQRLNLDGVIIIGGDDSNTNAAVLAEQFEQSKLRTRVIGCPKTIDGDLKITGQMDISFGFDTACKTYSELIGNVCLDALSSGKYYHFIRLMGRAASNITLECALLTQPNVTLIGEEVAARNQNLSSVTEEIVHIILEREKLGKNYGVVLVPEGLIEFVPEMNVLLHEINELLASGTAATVEAVADELSANSAALFHYLPASIRKQVLADRDPHGNVQVSLIETEKLLAETVQHELHRLHKQGKYKSHFSPQFHFYGYEGRCGLPSDFDTEYCYALGYNAAALVRFQQTGLMSAVLNLDAPVSSWTCGGLPITALMNLERRHGKDKPVIKKALVELKSLPFKTFAANREAWAVGDKYRCCGPIQLGHYGDKVDLCKTLSLELQEQKEAKSSKA
jgi:diphosphate-dependent phosphofructokinase